MVWRYDNGVKCPRCDSKATVMVEKYVADGGTVVRYLVRCSSCGYRRILQELTISRTDVGLKVKIAPIEHIQQRIKE